MAFALGNGNLNCRQIWSCGGLDRMLDTSLSIRLSDTISDND